MIYDIKSISIYDIDFTRNYSKNRDTLGDVYLITENNYVYIRGSRKGETRGETVS